MLDNIELRAQYCQCLIELAEKNPKIILCEADLMKATGTSAFQEKFPERTFDVGVAEANMIGVSAGLANEGFIPFANTFTPFATRRCFDQIAISVVYAKLNVKIGGTDPGICAELNGGTHMSFEDVGIMRTLPTMTIVEPIDCASLKVLMPQIAEHDGPVYIRLFRKKAEKVYEDGVNLTLGKANILKEGKDVVIFATGIMVKTSLDAAQMLEREGIQAKVVHIHTIKPLDIEAVISATKETGAVVTAENANIINGLGSAVAEILGENCPSPMKRIGVKDIFGQVGKIPFLAEYYEMTAEHVFSAAKEVISKKK